MKGREYPCGCRRKNRTPSHMIVWLHLCEQHRWQECAWCGYALRGPDMTLDANPTCADSPDGNHEMGRRDHEPSMT